MICPRCRLPAEKLQLGPRRAPFSVDYCERCDWVIPEGYPDSIPDVPTHARRSDLE